MLLTIIFGLLNALFSFLGNQYLKFSAFDITPAAIIIIAWSDGNIWVSSIILVLAYAIITPKEFRFIWFTLPMAFIIGYLALFINSAFLLLLIFHLIGVTFSAVFGYFNGRYVGFVIANFILNLVVIRFYSLFF